MDPISRHRLRWFLRGERALGLSYVYTPGAALVTDVAAPAERAGPVADDAGFRGVPAAGRSAQGRNVPEPSRDGRVNLPPPATFDHTVVPGAAPPAAPAALFAPAPVEPFAAPELSPPEKAEALLALDEQFVRGCVKCPLSRTRRNTVFGEGNPDARLMFVGEGPGGTEDETGRPFVGRAGQKLDEMIAAMKLSRKDVYICNVVKCRAFLPGPPPKDRPPMPEEVSACMPYLQRQAEIVRPQIIVTLGLSASQHLLGVKQSMSRMRGNWYAWRGIPVMPTFHPSYILRNYTTETRRAVWEDLKQVIAKLSAAGPRRRN